MNPDFQRLLSASPEDIRGLCTGTARRIGTNERFVEKDLWVCWTLDALFNGLPPGSPRLLFKGGTSLSKVFSLIRRFSEDIDVTVFREDIGHSETIDDLEEMSRKERERRLEAIQERCHRFVDGALREHMTRCLDQILAGSTLDRTQGEVLLDPEESSHQTLLVRYPSVFTPIDYVKSVVRIEMGARSAIDPSTRNVVVPYIAPDLADLEINVPNIVAIDPSRTFWDKVMIIHGLRCWFDARGEIKKGGDRLSRHYYDIHSLMATEVGERAIANKGLGRECARHARLFFYASDLKQRAAEDGNFSIVPSPEMAGSLSEDYTKMREMLFGEVPPFDAIMASVAALQTRIT